MLARVHYREVVTPQMRVLLVVVLAAFALLVVDSAYLSLISLLEWWDGEPRQGVSYQYAFLIHLVLGVLLIVPTLVYAGMHLRRAISRPNRLAVRLGVALLLVIVIVFVTGVLLTRGIPGIELADSTSRSVMVWLHIAAPLVAAWLFVLHRLAGAPIRWFVGGSIAAVSLVVSFVGLLATAPAETTAPPATYFPSLAKTVEPTGIEPAALMRDDYCGRCHTDALEGHAVSVHRFASFNNPAYRFSVEETRDKVLARDGHVEAARFCAGCHDPVPLFSGAFDDPTFDAADDTANAGITCLVCHAIERVDDVRGNGSYVLATPVHYPFAFAESELGRWISDTLIESKPDFHKQSFLKPLHQTPEFCGTCHKVHLPEELNEYRWLRGQNHYDSFLLSGVSGHGVASFYYPPKAETSCNGCHMRLEPSDDLAARPDEEGVLSVSSHAFPAANTAIPHLLGLDPSVNEGHAKELRGALSVDIFAIRRGDGIEGAVRAPLDGRAIDLDSGTHVVDIVLRTRTLGHLFTQGTSDSNQIWLEVVATLDGEEIAASGRLDPTTREVDPGAHFVNAYVLDREGRRIDRRNAEDIFTRLYDHQIPPGAADTVHYRLDVPTDRTGRLVLEARLHYRKFDTFYLRLFTDAPGAANDLPVVTIAEDRVTFLLDEEGQADPVVGDDPARPLWERWNDYGIGFLRKPDRGAFRQAESAFARVVELGRAEGHLNQARVWLREGRLDDALDALLAAQAQGAYPWSVAWFGGLVDLQNGEFDSAIAAFGDLVETRFPEARSRGFDFARDYRLRNTRARAYFERSKIGTPEERTADLQRARDEYNAALTLDPENVVAHYGITQVFEALGDREAATRHRALHGKYRPDDNAQDRAVAIARQNDAAANHAAEAVVIYPLNPIERSP